MNAPGKLKNGKPELVPFNIWLENLLRQNGQNQLADNLRSVLQEMVEVDSGIVEHEDGTRSLAA